MDWLRLHLRFSLGLGWQDAIRKTSEHIVIGVIVVLTGAVLAWLSTGQFGDALLLLLAWPAAFAVVYAYFFIRRLFRRNPLWQQLPDRVHTEEAGQVLELSVQRRNFVVDNTDITCWVVDIAGHEIELTNGGYTVRGLAYYSWIGIAPGEIHGDLEGAGAALGLMARLRVLAHGGAGATRRESCRSSTPSWSRCAVTGATTPSWRCARCSGSRNDAA